MKHTVNTHSNLGESPRSYTELTKKKAIPDGYHLKIHLVQFSLVTQLCPTLCNPMDWSTPSFLVHHQLPELAQALVH